MELPDLENKGACIYNVFHIIYGYVLPKIVAIYVHIKAGMPEDIKFEWNSSEVDVYTIEKDSQKQGVD
jgi:hypothetical protein